MVLPEQPLGFAVITSREIYDAVVRLTGRVDVLIEGKTHSDRNVTDHEGRLRVLERARWPLPSLAVVLSMAALVIAYFVR